MKNFSLKQLYSIVDGRLSTNMGDVYDMLNHITNSNLFTHQLPTALNFLKEVNPIWYQDVKADIENVRQKVGDEFTNQMDYIDENNRNYIIPQLSDYELRGFNEYMVDNSLLKKLGSELSS